MDVALAAKKKCDLSVPPQKMAESAPAEPNDTPDFRQYEGLFSEYAKEISTFPNDVLMVNEEKKQLRALDRTLFVRFPSL